MNAYKTYTPAKSLASLNYLELASQPDVYTLAGWAAELGAKAVTFTDGIARIHFPVDVDEDAELDTQEEWDNYVEYQVSDWAKDQCREAFDAADQIVVGNYSCPEEISEVEMCNRIGRNYAAQFKFETKCL